MMNLHQVELTNSASNLTAHVALRCAFGVDLSLSNLYADAADQRFQRGDLVLASRLAQLADEAAQEAERVAALLSRVWNQ